MDSLLSVIYSVLPALLMNVLLAGLTAWIAVRISLKKFSSQRWWERQEEAYAKIIEALSEIRYLLGFLSNDALGAKSPVGEEEKIEVWEKLQGKLNHLQRIAHIGTFRISATAVNELNSLFGKIYPALPTGESRFIQDTIADYLKEIVKCQNIIETEARRDLGLPTE